MGQDTKIIASQWIGEVWNRRNISLVDEMHTEDCLWYESFPEVVRSRDLASLKRWIARLHALLPDLHVVADSMVAEGNKLAIFWSAWGRPAVQSPGSRSQLNDEWFGSALLGFRTKRINEVWIVVGQRRLHDLSTIPPHFLDAEPPLWGH